MIVSMLKLRDDLRRLWKHAAALGVVIALLCHLLPRDWQSPCDALARLCTIEGR